MLVCDIVISYVQPKLNILVAEACLETNKNLVSASYVTPEIASLDKKVKKKKLIFLNEVGLDPGLDHISTMKIVDECKANGEK